MSIFWPSSMCIGDSSRRFRWILAYQRQVLNFSKAGLLEEIYSTLMWYKWNDPRPQVELFFVLGGLQSTFLPEPIDYSVSSCLMNIKMQSNMININSSFRHASHSATLVSGRFLWFHIYKFHQFTVICWCVLPNDIVNTFFFATTFNNHHFLKVKWVSVIVARATIKQRVINQQWLWSDS